MRSDLAKATDEGGEAEDLALSMARQRVLNSPRTNLEVILLLVLSLHLCFYGLINLFQFRKLVSRKVDFQPEERVFSHLASLTLSDRPTGRVSCD